ncbi:MAG TPA: hypothetical protein VH458_12180 [Vicinamibacterales bacterium]
MTALRWVAIAIVLAAIWDPAIVVSRDRRPPVDLDVAVGHARASSAAQIEAALKQNLVHAGFSIDAEQAPAARVVVADRIFEHRPDEPPVWAIDLASRAVPGVRIVHTSSADRRVPGQAARVSVTVEGVGVSGETTELRLEHEGVPVASDRHVWRLPVESWTTTLEYLPPFEQMTSATVRALRVGRDRVDDDRSDVRLAGQRSPFRVLAYDTTLSWPATFVRRSLEGQPAFALSVLERAAPGTSTRAGGPPRNLSSADLAPYDLVIVGAPEELTASETTALRQFVEVRGGAVVLVPARRPSGGSVSLMGQLRLEERVLEQPVQLAVAGKPPLRASEMLIARPSNTTTRVLAAVGKDADPVVVSVRRGAGIIVFSGALDAWRSRAADEDAFARFWRTTLSEAALAVPPRLKIDAEPGLVQTGQRTRIRVALRSTELPADINGAVPTSIAARIVAPERQVDQVVRLWPGSEPGVFEGEWTADAAGHYVVTTSSGSLHADAVILVEDRVTAASAPDPEGLALTAAASGGSVRPPGQIADLVSSLARAFPARPTPASLHPMRSPWWSVAFALALSIEWGWRRMHGGR